MAETEYDSDEWKTPVPTPTSTAYRDIRPKPSKVITRLRLENFRCSFGILIIRMDHYTQDYTQLKPRLIFTSFTEYAVVSQLT